jgi:hypothetical protein
VTGAPVHMLDDAVRDYYDRDKGVMRFLDDASEMIVCRLFRFKDSKFQHLLHRFKSFWSRGRDLFLEVDDCKDRKF